MAAEHADSRDERIGRILNDYLDHRRRGEAVHEEDLLKAHPDLADDLREHFGMVRQVRPIPSDDSGSGGLFATPRPDLFPGYQILGEIHRGGQGVVYEALQKTTQRKVAIKVMREGPFAGWRDRARFEREVRILAALKHPSIVTVHESGMAAGCQFVVMDYIPGLPLDVWVSKEPQSVERILKLFTAICDAVNAAHIKGIIHRDLKPGNIRIDEEGQPHILDFGVAKVTARDQHDKENRETANMTVTGQFVGSLPWTSPEQAQGLLDHIDTRTDVYALGVILYQMLTGAFPYDVTGPVRDVLNRIVSGEQIRPSTIRKEIDREVEAIVLKCLRKESQWRYQTAGELARDIERYLKGEPIAAKSDSGWYVMGKMLRRYRVPVAVATAFGMLITLSLLGSLSLWQRAVKERDRAIAARQEQDQQRRRADTKAAEAEEARRIAEQERSRAQDQAEKLRWATYLNHLALAQNAWDQRYTTQAQRLLKTCPIDLRGWEWHYLVRLTSSPTLLDISADPKCVIAMTITPDGKYLITGGYDGVIKIWDSKTGTAITQLTGHTDQVTALAISPDGRQLASGGRDRTLRLWDRFNGSSQILQEGKEYINCVCFSPDGSYLVAGGQAKVLTFWDARNGRMTGTSPAHRQEVSCVAWSPDGKRVISGEFLSPSGGGGRIRFWDSVTRQMVRELAGHPGAVLSLAFSRDGGRIASGGGIAPAGRDARGTLKIIDGKTGEEQLSLTGHDGFVDSVAFSPDGKLLASAGVPSTPAFGMESDHTLRVWDAATGEQICTYSAHDHGGRSVVWSPDANRLFSAGMDGHLKAWPSTTPPAARSLNGLSGTILRIAFSPDGKRLVSSDAQSDGNSSVDEGKRNAIRIWNLETGTQLLELPESTKSGTDLAWSPDGRYIATGGDDRKVHLWDSAGGTSRILLTNSEDSIQSVAFSPDSTLLAAVAGRTATILHIPDGKEHSRLWHNDTPCMISFSADGNWLATAMPAGTIRIWNRKAGSEHRSIQAGSGLNGAWFSTDSGTIASAHINGTIILWEVSTGKQVAIMRGPSRSVEWLDFSPDGRRIASCTSNMMLSIWDVPSATEVFSVRAHNAPVTCVRFNPGGTAIATCGQDGLIKLWETKIEPISQTTRASY